MTSSIPPAPTLEISGPALDWARPSSEVSSVEALRARLPSTGPRRDSHMALDRLVCADDISVVFQPIVDLASGRLYAQEALVRCRRPGLEYPPTLFARAVASGCAGRLGRLIREIAVPLAAGGPLFLNVHPQELQEGWLVRPDDPIFVHDHEVFLEVTEAVPLAHHRVCRDVLAELRARGGIHLAVDDLGAGYSNLRHIVDLEPSMVKLDRGLVAGIDRSPRQHQLVRSIVQLCGELGATVVAEGIETEDELLALSDTGAHYGQGYLLARPAFPAPSVSWRVTIRP